MPCGVSSGKKLIKNKAVICYLTIIKEVILREVAPFKKMTSLYLSTFFENKY